MFVKIIALALLGVCLGSPSADQYIDNVLQTSFANEIRAQGLDPAPLPNFNVKFGVAHIYNSQGEANFFDGKFKGFSNLRRRFCQGPVNSFNQISINCTLSMFTSIADYSVSVRNMSRVYNWKSMGHVSETLIDVKIVGQGIGALRSLDIQRLGLITPTFHPMPKDLIIYQKVLQDGFRAQVSTQLYSIIRERVRYAFERAIQNVPLPRQ